ncbi:NADP-dependent oxidoreductase [Algihabitans albus]|uniref:NADP-dependent oxidoreductase n=1 Tax=Algihabitans albus TaxID=2164067 RepID=UPI000E5C607A|nr:NADP-dependent oxidoreductase [Algihabitans albus]
MSDGKRILLTAHPEGMPDETHLRLEPMAIPRPGPGELLLRTVYLSLDPYMRGRMNPAKSYAQPVKLGETMVGGTVCEVIESHLDGFAAGDLVLAAAGWQTHALSDGTGLRKLDPRAAPVTTALGVMGMPGLTAYVGLLDHGRPKPGETVVVSAAAGAVGQIVGQIAKLQGCRVVGVAGAPDKCAYVVEELGFDAAVNYRDVDFAKRLSQACDGGVDVYFENVGGAVFNAVLPLMNDFGRIPVCGRIAHYNNAASDKGAEGGASELVRTMGLVLVRRLTLRGFIVSDHADRLDDFLRDMGEWLRSGQLRYREDLVQGLESAVGAFQGLLEGRNRGKLLVQVGTDPTLQPA